MKNRLLSFFKEEDGATIVEYVIMISVVAGIALFAFPSLRKALVGWITGAFADTDGGIGQSTNDYICVDGTTVKDLSLCK